MNGPLAPDELATPLAGGEDGFTEFKDARTTTGELAKEMCAFANASGGHILIGVDDEGHPHDASSWDEERVIDVASAAIDPPLIPTCQRLRWSPEQTVVIVGVPEGAQKPYSARARDGCQYCIRAGSTSREASREELIRLTQASGAVASDLRPVLGATLDDLGRDLLAERFAGRPTLDLDALSRDQLVRVLTDAEILHPQTGGPTIAGLLCFGRSPSKRLPYVALPRGAPASQHVSRESGIERTALTRNYMPPASW